MNRTICTAVVNKSDTMSISTECVSINLVKCSIQSGAVEPTEKRSVCSIRVCFPRCPRLLCFLGCTSSCPTNARPSLAQPYFKPRIEPVNQSRKLHFRWNRQTDLIGAKWVQIYFLRHDYFILLVHVDD